VSQAEAAVEVEAERRRVAGVLERLNTAYESRFGFRYVIFVAGRPRAAIVPLMEAALNAKRGAERRRALRDVVAIARDRAARMGLVSEDVGPEDGRPMGDSPADRPDGASARRAEEEGQ
jgi:2-oxo-4-hydroxy-4-carboxy--5-ureidoimidazoline (OHCU) decarboxylase